MSGRKHYSKTAVPATPLNCQEELFRVTPDLSGVECAFKLQLWEFICTVSVLLLNVVCRTGVGFFGCNCTGVDI